MAIVFAGNSITTCPGVTRTLSWSSSGAVPPCGGSGGSGCEFSPSTGGSVPVTLNSGSCTVIYNCANSSGIWGTEDSATLTVVNGSGCCGTGSQVGLTVWNGSTCVAPSYSCSGTAPSGGNFSSRGASTANGTWSYAGSGECTWSCNSGYVQSGNTCVIPSYSCFGTAPSGSGFTSDYAYSANGTWTYAGSGECTWRCNSGYTQSGNTCVENQLPNPNPFNASCTQTGPGAWTINFSYGSVAGADSYPTRIQKYGGSMVTGTGDATSDSFSVSEAGQYDTWVHALKTSTNNWSSGVHYNPVTCVDSAAANSPTGYVDGVSSGVSCGYISGWAFDADVPGQSIEVHIYVDGNGYNLGATSGLRSDVNTAFGIAGLHGYTYQIPGLTPGNHTVDAYGIGINGSGSNDGDNVLLSGSPFSFSCTAPSYTCGGSVPAQSSTCGIPANGTGQNYNLVASCGSTPCSYACWSGYHLDGGVCVANSGTISASPNPCTIASGASTCSSSITWSSNVASASVTVPALFSSSPGGTQSAPWIGVGSTVFTLKDSEGNTLGSVSVNGQCISGTAWNGSVCAPTPCSNGANNPPTCNTCTLPLVWNGISCVVPDACGPQSGTIQPSEPTGSNACSSGSLNSSSPAKDTASNWNWTCGSLACSAQKAGCNVAVDTNYSGPIPANNYNCALTCANGGVDFPTCTPNENCVGSWINNGTCSVSGACGQTGSIQQTYSITQPQSGTGTACPASNGDTRWGSTSCSTAICPTGSFTPGSASCLIPNNTNSCSATVSWLVNNPITSSAVTRDGTGGDFATGHSGTASFSTNYSSQIYRLYNNSTELDSVAVTSDCLSSSARSGGLCIACAYSGCTGHVCNNGANNPPACNQCPANQAWNGSSCIVCSNGGCTGPGGSSVDPDGGLVCNNTSIDVPVCTPKPNQTITANGGTDVMVSYHSTNNATLVWSQGSNHSTYPYSSCSALGPWGNTFPPYSGTGLTTPLIAGTTYSYGYQCTNAGGTTVANADVEVCASIIPVLKKDDISCQDRPNAALSFDDPTGNYTPTGHLILTCDFSDAYVLTRDGLSVDFGPIAIDHFTLNKDINTAGDYVLTCRYTSGDGHTFSHTSNTIKYFTKPTPPEVSLYQTPASVSKGSASVIRWSVKFPNSVQVPERIPACSLTAKAVCIGICKADQTTEQNRINALLLAEQTDANDPDTPRLISNAVNNLVKPISMTVPISEDWYARGKKTINLNKSMDFILNCGSPGDHASSTVRVQVTSSNEG